MPSGGASTPSLIARARQPTADLIGKRLAEFQRPLPHTLAADDDAASGQYLLDHAQAERETETQPNRVADDVGRKPVAGVAGEASIVIPFGYATSPATASRQLDGAPGLATG